MFVQSTNQWRNQTYKPGGETYLKEGYWPL